MALIRHLGILIILIILALIYALRSGSMSEFFSTGGIIGSFRDPEEVKKEIQEKQLSSDEMINTALGNRKGFMKNPPVIDKTRRLTLEQLKLYDGTKSTAAYIAVNNKIYDVTKSKYFKFGKYKSTYRAGRDYTKELGNSPDLEIIFEGVPIVGNIVEKK